MDSEISRPLTGEEVLRLVDGKAKVLSYKNIQSIRDINELFEPYNAVIFLYETKDNYGHWVALIRHPPSKKFPKGHIEHTDSYALMPDDELKFATAEFKKQNGMEYPKLLKLYYDSGLPVDYNNTRLQQKGGNIATCGRWVAMRILLRDLTLPEFIKFIKQSKKLGYTPDEFITAITTAMMD